MGGVVTVYPYAPHGFQMFYDWPRGAKVSSRQDHEPEPVNPKPNLGQCAKTYWLLTQLFNFWGSYKVVDSESFNFYVLGFWASEKKG